MGGVNHLSAIPTKSMHLMGFPTILSCISDWGVNSCRRKYSKLTFSNGSQLIGKKAYGTFTCIIQQYIPRKHFQDFHQMSEPGREGQSSFKLSRLNLNWKILGDILVSQTGGSIIFQLLILNTEMWVLHSYILWSFLQY